MDEFAFCLAQPIAAAWVSSASGLRSSLGKRKKFSITTGAAQVSKLLSAIWVAPGINADIAHETEVRLRNGLIDQADRQELVRYQPKDQRRVL